MSEPVTLAELRGVDLFDDIDDDQLAEWVAVAGVESLEPGGLIFEQGVEPPGLKLLLEGEAIVVLVEGERTEPVGRQFAPTWIGAIAVLTGGPLGVRMKAETPCRVALVEADDFRRLVFSQPPVHRRVMEQVAPVMSRIENYLGFPAGLSGSDLARRATDQARRLGAELLTVQDAVGLRAEGAGRIVELSGGGELSANCVLVASGVSYRQHAAPGFAELTGTGVYYGAALAEARSCENQRVAIVGGANSAGQGAVYFSEFADSVTMLVRAPTLARSMSHYLIEQLDALPNVTVRTETVAIAAEGSDGRLRRLRVRGPDGQSALEVDACFVFIGASPRTDWLEGVVARDERGFILAGTDAQTNGWPLGRDPYPLETSVPGVFVAGDVRARSIKRVASAVGEGSMAVSLIHEYLANV
jgi:thioredoxin reductase